LVDGIRYHWIKTSAYETRGLAQIWNQFQFIFGCFRQRKNISRLRPDVIIASSPHPFVIYPAAAIARLLGVPLVYEVRDLWPQVLIELRGFSRWHPYILVLGCAEKYAVRHARMILSVKEGDFEYFSHKYGLQKSAFRYIPNGFLPVKTGYQEIPENYRKLRQKYDFLLVYVGAVSTYYKLDKLIVLARQLSDLENLGIVVVGSGDYSETLERNAREDCLNNFHMLGTVPKSVVPAILNHADACYAGLADLPLNRYGISCNKIYEYMYAAKPIIGHYQAGYDPIELAGCGVTASAGEENVLVSAIKDWMNNPELAKSLGKRGREYFEKHHDFRKVSLTLHREMSALKEDLR
jgi:glycosyltransferase involved in cell wall biosynthesis